MAVPTVMRWDHKNAPVIDDFRDWVQIKAWYQAIFVDGYLADDDVTPIPGLGWDVTVDDGTYRDVYLSADSGADNQVVNRFTIRFMHRQMVLDAGSNYYGGQIRTYENSNLTGLITDNYDINYPQRGCWPFFGMTLTRGCVTPWVIIGSTRGFYAFSGYNNHVLAPTKPGKFSSVDNYSQWRYFGDFINDGDADMGIYNQCCTYDVASTSYEINTSDHCASNNALNQYSTIVRATRIYPAMTDTAVSYASLERHWNNTNNYYIGNPAYGIKYPYHDGGFYIKPVELYYAVSGEATYFGKMPGMYYSSHKRPLSHGNSLLEFDGQGAYADKHFLGMGQLSYSEFYINVTDDWGIA